MARKINKIGYDNGSGAALDYFTRPEIINKNDEQVTELILALILSIILNLLKPDY